MDAKHTAGPWVQHSLMVTEADWTPGSNGKGIAHCGVGMRLNSDLDESEANARLIAAAPELPEALKAVVSVADRATDEFDRARAAIAKATGE